MFSLFHKMQTRSRMLNSTGYSPFIFSSDGKVITANTVDVDTALMNSDVFTVINRISSDVAGCDIDCDAPAIQQALRKPSAIISGFNLWQSVVAQMMLTGNAYVLIHRDNRGNRGAVSGFELIPFEDVMLTLNDDSTAITYTINFEDDRGQRIYQQSDILHFRLFVNGQMATELVGVSPLDALKMELNIQDKSKKLSLGMLVHAISPSYTLTVPQGILNEEAKENIRSAFEVANSGENAGRAIVLDQGIQLGTLQISPDLAKLLTNMNFAQNQIAKAFNVPVSILNGESDQQSSIEMLENQYENALRLYIKPLESEMFLKLGVHVHFDTTPITDTNHTVLIDNLAKLACGRNPAMTPLQVQTLLKQYGVFPKLKLDPNVPTMKGGETDEQDGHTNDQ